MKIEDVAKHLKLYVSRKLDEVLLQKNPIIGTDNGLNSMDSSE